MSPSLEQQLMNYNDITYNPLRKSYNLQHQQHLQLSGLTPFTTPAPAAPQSLLGSVFMPFKQMGKTIVDLSMDKLDFGGDSSTSYGTPVAGPTYGAPGPVSSYGAPAVDNSYGAPTPTLYGGDSGVTGISAINSDSLPFFAGAAAIAAIGAFCLSVAATGANVTIGKRSADYSIVKEVSQQLLDVMEDSYQPTIAQGFEQLSGALDQPCVRRLLCKGASHVFDEFDLDDLDYRMQEAFDLMKQGNEVRNALHEVFDKAENEECGRLPCWGGLWDTII